MGIKSHIFNKTYLLLLEIQLSQVYWRKDLKRQDFCKEWKTTLRCFFFTASLATNLNIYSSARIALLKTKHSISQAINDIIWDSFSQYLWEIFSILPSLLLPASNRSVLKHSRHSYGYTRKTISFQKMFTKPLFTSVPQPTITHFRPQDSMLVLRMNDTKYLLGCQTLIQSIALTSRRASKKLA